jgi:hypothetical protein
MPVQECIRRKQDGLYLWSDQMNRTMMKYVASLCLLSVLLYSCHNNAPDLPAVKSFDTVTVSSFDEPADPHQIRPTGDAPEQFVPAGYFIQYSAEGDINGDGLEDAAMVLREIKDSTAERAFVVLTQQTGTPKYKLADAGWSAIGPQYTGEGYEIRGTEDLSITNGAIELQLYDPGPSGNLFSTYRFIDGNIQLTTLETFNQGAGGASGSKWHLLTGEVESTEINRMKDPEESTESTNTIAPQKVLLRDSDPETLTNK